MDIHAIAARIRAGDKDALRELIASYGAGVYEKAYQSTKNPTFAKEATRKTFQQFVSGLQANPNEDGFTLLLDMIAGQNIERYQKLSATMQDISNDVERTCFQDPAPAPAQTVRPPQPAAPSMRPEPMHREAPVQAPVRTVAPQQPSRPVTERRAGEKRTKAERIFIEKREKEAKVSFFPVFLLVLVSLVLLWLVLGVMMSLKWIPVLDMGYRWFNAHVFKFF